MRSRAACPGKWSAGRPWIWPLALLLIGSCDGGTALPEVEFRIPVEVRDVVTGTVEDLIVVTGTLRPREIVVLNVETPGFLVLGRTPAEQRLAEGDAVQAGQLIAEITGEDARLAARMDATRLHLESARAELERRRQLFEQHLIAQEDLHRAEALYEDKLHDFETSKRTFEKTRLTTPITGVVLKLARNADGEPVADGQKVLQGFEVARIAPSDQLIADVDLVGPELDRVRPGQEVRITHYAFERTTFSGRVLRLAPAMDARTHTFRVEVEIDNPDGLLRPGMFVQAAIVAERRENVTIIPRQALAERSGRSVVFAVDGQRAEVRDIVLGLSDDEILEVIEGIDLGERIVVRGIETLTDGTRVRVVSR